MHVPELVLLVDTQSEGDLEAIRVGMGGVQDLGPVDREHVGWLLLRERPDLVAVSCPPEEAAFGLVESLSQTAGRWGIPLLTVFADPAPGEKGGRGGGLPSDPFKVYESSVALLGSLCPGRFAHACQSEETSGQNAAEGRVAANAAIRT